MDVIPISRLITASHSRTLFECLLSDEVTCGDRIGEDEGVLFMSKAGEILYRLKELEKGFGKQ
jgi:hypothetical protein